MIVPKTHGTKITDVPDDELAEAMPVAKKIAAALQVENYNVLQNNGRLAHQEVDHVTLPFFVSWFCYGRQRTDAGLQVHFHVIPKPNQSEGLGIEWPAQKTDMDALKELHAKLKSKM